MTSGELSLNILLTRFAGCVRAAVAIYPKNSMSSNVLTPPEKVPLLPTEKEPRIVVWYVRPRPRERFPREEPNPSRFEVTRISSHRSSTLISPTLLKESGTSTHNSSALPRDDAAVDDECSTGDERSGW
jgi:hypothetical protein